MKPIHTSFLKNSLSISNSNKQCQICTEQQGLALILISKLYDHGWIVVADENKCILCKNKPIMKAFRCLMTRIHIMDLRNLLQTQLISHANLQQITSIERMKFSHNALGYLALSTLVRAIYARFLNSLPDLAAHNVSKLGPLDITILGHLDIKRKISNQLS